MSGISQICTITLVFRLAAPEFHLTACRAAGSPVTTALTKWSRSVLADLVPAIEPNLHPALQNKASCCLYSFTVILSLSLVPLTWKNLKYCNIWNTACKEPAVDQAQQHWWQKKGTWWKYSSIGDAELLSGKKILQCKEKGKKVNVHSWTRSWVKLIKGHNTALNARKTVENWTTS